ncbi:MAG: xanthine dehydrogenase family protein molybdopterin-binding subunit [Desulfobacterales bacterium]|nr:xanthine dehydrogenase family protein molybdopterin-binding subunit [Desulfobacterales bacterium]
MKNSGYEIIGKSIPRVEGPAKATGEALYTADIRLPGMLVGRILHSPYPHARILNVNTDRARRVPGVRAVVAGRDTLGVKVGQLGADEPAMAVDKVRYLGEAVAAVAARDEDAAEEALELLQVDYEPLPAVFDVDSALKSGAPVVHDDTPGNVSVQIKRQWGNLEEGFAQSDLVMEDTFTTQSVVHCSLEPHAALAEYAGGQLTLWSTTQGPFYIRKDLAQALGMPEGDLRVIKPHLGGGFGGKRELTATDFAAALLAIHSGRPVRVLFDREEEFYAGRQRHPMKIKLKIGMNRDGLLKAKDCLAMVDGGAYKSRGVGVVMAAADTLVTLLKAPNVQYLGVRAYTNNPVSGAFRGFGLLQIRYAEECLLDMMAVELGLDRAEVRLKNAVQVGDKLPNGITVNSCGLSECIRKATASAGYKAHTENKMRNTGMGLACEDYVSGFRLFPEPDTSAAKIEVEPDGLVKLFTGSSDIGQGSDTTLAQIAAEVLGVSMKNIKVIAADTQVTPLDLGTYASRLTFIAGNAVKKAAEGARNQLAEFLAKKWACRPEQLLFRQDEISLPETEHKIPLAQAAAMFLYEERKHVVALEEYDSGMERPDFMTGYGQGALAYSYGAQVAHVRVEPETGRVKVLSVSSAEDCGRAINPMSLEGQAEGSIACGTGMTLLEERFLDRGITLNPSLLEYKIPTIWEAPPVISEVVETIDPNGPFGAKGVSEGYQVPTAPAITNAVTDAIGVRIKELPLSPEKIWKIMGGKRSPNRR